jgi:hypothetical protein
MTTSQHHYDKHLGPIYAWSAGGFDAALQRGNEELTALAAFPAYTDFAVDLGAGFGMHALARNGYDVLAIDSCKGLLNELLISSDTLPIQCVTDDLANFKQYLKTAPELILCMGDTLTHLDNRESVKSLIAMISEALCDGGCFVTSFRDYTVELKNESRFIPVRSDEDRILTCFLEYSDAMVKISDLLHEKRDGVWDLSISSYYKLRLSPEWVMNVMEAHGFSVKRSTGLSGMVRLEGYQRQHHPSSGPGE